jgi:hypothetical protein
VLSFDDGERLSDVTADNAKLLCDAGYASPVDEVFSAFIGAIEMLIPDDEMREFLNGREKPKGRPVPTLSPASSTGDAGRGLGAVLGRHRVIHYDAAGIRA